MEERMPKLIGEEMHLLLPRLGGITQDQPSVYLADGQMSAFAISGGTPTDLCRIRRTAAGEPPRDGGVGRCTEIVGIRYCGVAISQRTKALRNPRGAHG